MITRQRQLFYFVGDCPFTSLEEAQKADLLEMLSKDGSPVAAIDHVAQESFALWMIQNKAAIIDNLSTTPRSRLRARKLHGGTRKNKPANERTQAQVPAIRS